MLQLIAEALNNAPEKTLVMADIFMAISDEYPYCQALETVGWQNNIKPNSQYLANWYINHLMS